MRKGGKNENISLAAFFPQTLEIIFVLHFSQNFFFYKTIRHITSGVLLGTSIEQPNDSS
jgi:hypothetical protein